MMAGQANPSRAALQAGVQTAIGKAAAALGPYKLPVPVVLYLMAVMTPATIQLGPLFLTLPRIYLIIMFVPLVIMLLSGKRTKIIITDILFILHAMWMALALWINNPDQMLTQIGSIVPEFYGAYLIARLYIRSEREFIALIRWLGVCILILFPFVVYEALTGSPPIVRFVASLPLVNSYNITGMESRLGLERVQGILTHPIHFGLLCSTFFALTVMGLKGVVSDSRRLITGAASGLSTFFSLSSGAFLALILQLIALVWYRIFRSTGRPWLILLVVAAICYVVVDLLSNRTPLRVFMSYATFSAHTAYWRGIIFEWGMKNVWANPYVGLGLNDWVRPSFMHSGSMDNFWLVMAVRYGIPGFLLVAAGYLIALWRVGRRNLQGDPLLEQLRRAWVLTFVCMTFTLCTVHVWNNAHSYVFFLFGSGMWFLTATPRSSESSDPAPDDAGAGRPGPRHSRFAPRPQRSGLAPAASTPDPGVARAVLRS